MAQIDKAGQVVAKGSQTSEAGVEAVAERGATLAQTATGAERRQGRVDVLPPVSLARTTRRATHGELHDGRLTVAGEAGCDRLALEDGAGRSRAARASIDTVAGVARVPAGSAASTGLSTTAAAAS